MICSWSSRLVWFTEHADQRGGGATTQSFESFLRSGPKVDHAPEHILGQLRKFLKRYYLVEPL